MTTTLRHPSSILALLLPMALAACGGSSSSTPDPIVATGTAYQKQLITQRRVGQAYGPKREFLQGQLDNCNDVRTSQYKLLPVAPDEAALAGIDDSVADHYFDTDKTALYVTANDAELSDYLRWAMDGPGTPAVAPDCSVVTRKQSTTAFIWRDGRLYELNFDNMQGQVQRSDTAVPRALMTEVERATLPVRTVLGEQCHVVNDPQGPFAADDACVWDRFPPVLYLDMPWALTTEAVNSDGIEQKMTTTEVNGHAGVPPSVFSIDGFTLIER